MNAALQQAIEHPTQFKRKYYFSKSWEIFQKAPWMFIGALLVGCLLSAIIGSIPYLGTVSGIFNSIFFAGFYIVAKKVHHNQSVEFNDFFGGFQKILPIVLASVLSTIFAVIGFALLIIPGIYLTIAYALVIPIVLFFDEGVWDSLEASRKIVTKNWWAFFRFFVLLLLFNFAGALCLVIGLLITLPVSIICFYVIFDDMIKTSEDTTGFYDAEVLDADV